MASHTVKTARTGVLVAGEVEVITFDSNVETVRVINLDGAAEIFVRVGGTSPTVGGDDAICLPAAKGMHAELRWSGAESSMDVRLISSGTPRYHVRVS